MRLSPASLLALVFIVPACDPARPPAPIVAASHDMPAPIVPPRSAPTPGAASTTVPITPDAAASGSAAASSAAEAPAKLSGGPTAVVLFGTRGLSDTEPLRFVPVLCSLQGKLATGKTCGEAMPARAQVKIVRSDPSLPSILTVARTTRDYRDDNGGQVYPAPTGPECCMYNTCSSATIPYLPVTPPRAQAKTVLAVWPEAADVGLKPAPHAVSPADAAAHPWPGQPGAKVEQAIRVGPRRLVSGRSAPKCLSCAELWFDAGHGFSRVGGLGMGADGYDVLVTSDVDGDGQPEAIVYERWRNDYGLHVLGNDWSKPAYRFSCGNI